MIPPVDQVFAEYRRLDYERDLEARPATMADVMHVARAVSALVHIYTDLADAGVSDPARRAKAQERIRIGLQAATEELEHLVGAP
jgi:anti-sigma factor RsiW